MVGFLSCLFIAMVLVLWVWAVFYGVRCCMAGRVRDNVKALLSFLFVFLGLWIAVVTYGVLRQTRHTQRLVDGAAGETSATGAVAIGFYTYAKYPSSFAFGERRAARGPGWANVFGHEFEMTTEQREEMHKTIQPILRALQPIDDLADTNAVHGEAQ